ncbi:MAG: hypothetical protein LDL33_11540 [Desulfomonile sp.]|nr:hypothetical protein [Desulfomonile sp.]
MQAEKIVLKSVADAVAAINAVGSTNSELMATRAIHINVLIRGVPGAEARALKKAYNDVGAEAAISHEAYYEKNGAITDMIAMGSIYQHREVRRVLADTVALRPLISALEAAVENAPEARSVRCEE